MISDANIFPCVLAFVMPSLFGADGLWMAVPVSELATSILAFLLFRKSDAANAKKVTQGKPA